MQDLNKYLIMLSDKFDRQGKEVCANVVDDLIQSDSLVKVAQYVGVIGYVLKQNRAMGNCIRKKRAAAGNRAMQEVVLECLKEYQDGQDYHDTEWHSKYAQTITDRPADFDKLHLEMFAQWGQEADIQSHVEKVENAAVVLHENGAQDGTINQVLSHVETLGNILKKEASTNLPFKLAAPPSSRNLWSRLWTPSQYHWWNPASWGGRWQRGEDQEVITEMSNVIEGIRNIAVTTQRMKMQINRLQSQVSGSMSGDPGLNNIVQIINQLDPTDWNKNLLATQQLRTTLPYTPAVDPQQSQMAMELVEDMANATNGIYDQIDDIQENMNRMRLRSPVRGRNSGLTGKGTKNPFGMSSPSEEFGVLERVLSKLYENPFSDEAMHYAQRMHARLDDRLRYIKKPDDKEVNDWLSNQPARQPQVAPTANPSAPTAPAPADSGPAPDTHQEDHIDNLINISPTAIPDPKQRAQFIAEILNYIMLYGNSDTEDPQLSAMIDDLVSRSMQNTQSDTAPTTPETTPETEPQAEPQAEPVELFNTEPPADEPYQPRKTYPGRPQWAQDLIDKATNREPMTDEETEWMSRYLSVEGDPRYPENDIHPLKREEQPVKVPTPSDEEPIRPPEDATDDREAQKEQRRVERENRKQQAKNRKRKRRTQMEARMQTINAPDYEIDEADDMRYQASVFDVIKIADVLDEVDPSLSDLIDKFLEEQSDIMFELPRFPEFGTVIKEKEKGHETPN